MRIMCTDIGGDNSNDGDNDDIYKIDDTAGNDQPIYIGIDNAGVRVNKNVAVLYDMNFNAIPSSSMSRP